jgi:hypothetical protein
MGCTFPWSYIWLTFIHHESRISRSQTTISKCGCGSPKVDSAWIVSLRCLQRLRVFVCSSFSDLLWCCGLQNDALRVSARMNQRRMICMLKFAKIQDGSSYAPVTRTFCGATSYRTTHCGFRFGWIREGQLAYQNSRRDFMCSSCSDLLWCRGLPENDALRVSARMNQRMFQ